MILFNYSYILRVSAINTKELKKFGVAINEHMDGISLTGVEDSSGL
jgi:hypothetical protein